MRTKIDYGIDLGTTNSAIARIENGKAVIKKSDTLKDTTPSCIAITKKKAFLAGDPALNLLNIERLKALKSNGANCSNSYMEFKRTMGTTHQYESSNLDKTISSEELSSEVLKKLKSYILDENVNAVVITVPAKFLNPQKDATMKAAKLAGFNHVELLQEPVAAATAYGLNSKKKDGYWVVFDFGGGTFDAAIIKSEEGILSVKDTAGNNWLGGKNLDFAIVDQIIIPYLRKTYAIDFVLEDSLKLQMLREAVKSYAEEAKNQLSFKEIHNILSNLGELQFEDENGEEPEIDLDITQADLQKVLSPIFQEAIDITKDLLKKNNLNNSDLDALILVGGPTHSPILRKMLKEQITENVDTSIDPMTAVAVGAALFASTISVSEEIKDNNRDKTKLQLEINYETTTVEFDEMINIQVLKDKTVGSIPENIYVEVVRSDKAWSSGKTRINADKKTILEILLVEGANQFNVFTYDDFGNKIECQPDSFNMLQGIGGLDSMTVLPYNIGIGKYFEEYEKDLFESVKGLEKNQKLPATGVRNGLKTRNTIRPGVSSDILRIPIYQGEHKADGTNPLLNSWVYDVIITGETIPKLLPEGSDVDITVKVDRSEKMIFSAFFPLIDHTEELEVDIKNTETPSVEKLSKEIKAAKNLAKTVKENEVYSKLESLESNLKDTGASPDGRLQILDGIRKELLKLDSKEKELLWPKVEQELKNAFYELEALIEKIINNGDDEKIKLSKVEEYIEEYKKKVELIINDKNVKAAKELTTEIGQLDFELRNIVTGNAMEVQILREINDDFASIRWRNPSKARQLVNQGMQMVINGSTRELRPVLIEIFSLMPEDQKPKETLK